MSSPTPAPVDFLVAVIAHRALLTDRLPSYLAILTENNFTILQQSTTLLTPTQSALLTAQPIDDAAQLFTPATPATLLLLSRTDAYATAASLLPQLDHVYASASRWEALCDRHLFFGGEGALERALLVMRSGYTQADYAVIMDELEAQHFVVVAKEGKILSADEAAQLAGEDRAAVEQLCSDVSLFIVVERRDALAALALLLGPVDPATARRVAPHTLRARLASQLHAPASAQQVDDDCRLVWPAAGGGFALERTVLVVGGPAREAEAELEAGLADEGFTVLARQDAYIGRQRAERLLRGRGGAEAEAVTGAWSAAPSLVLLVTKPAAVQHARLLVAQLPDDVRRYVHAPAEAAAAAADVRELFPLLPGAEAVSAAELAARFAAPTDPALSAASLQSVLTDALIALCRAKPSGAEAVTWLAHYLLQHNPNQPRVELPAAVAAGGGGGGGVERRVFVWAVEGVAGAAVDGFVKQGGYVVVDVAQLLAAAAASDAQYGAQIGALTQALRPVPAHITTALVDRAVAAHEQGEAGSRRPRYLLTGMPADLDTAFGLEAQYGPVAAVLVGGGGGDVKVGGGGVAGGVGDVSVLVDHYRVFGKVVEVDEAASGLQGHGPLHRLLTA